MATETQVTSRLAAAVTALALGFCQPVAAQEAGQGAAQAPMAHFAPGRPEPFELSDSTRRPRRPAEQSPGTDPRRALATHE